MALPVMLNVYDVVKPSKAKSSSMAALVKLNSMTAGLRFGGCFHGGIVVDGIEWSYGYSATSSGVYCVEPGKNPQYRFRETISLGTSPLASQQVREVLRRMRQQWLGYEYDLLAHNCCHFCEAFAQHLGCKAPPGWLNRFAQSADVARSLGTRSAQVLRSSLAKMLLLNHDSKGVHSSSRSECGGQTPGSSRPSTASAPNQRHGFLQSARIGADGDVDLCARSAGYPYSTLESSLDTDDVDDMFARPGVRTPFMPIREGSDCDSPSDEAEKQLPLFARRGLRAPTSYSGADEPCSPVGGTQESTSCLNSFAVETMFARPASLQCEDAYLFGFDSLQPSASLSPTTSSQTGVERVSDSFTAREGKLVRQDQLQLAPSIASSLDNDARLDMVAESIAAALSKDDVG